MKYVAKQCRVCPFRKTSAQGWLGDYTARTVFSSIWEGIPFFCHDSMDYRDPNAIPEAVANPKKGKLCVGGLVFANKIPAPERSTYPIILEAREKVKLRTDIECMEPKEFLDHHPDWQEQAEEKLRRRLADARAAKSVEKSEESEPGNCPKCSKPLGKESFCFGCKSFVCDDCETSLNIPMGRHRPEDHFDDELPRRSASNHRR